MILKTYILILFFYLGHLCAYLTNNINPKPTIKEVASFAVFTTGYIEKQKFQRPSCDNKKSKKSQVAVGVTATLGLCQDLMKRVLGLPSIDDLFKDILDKEIKNFGNEIDKTELDKLLEIVKQGAKKRGIKLGEGLINNIVSNSVERAILDGIKVDEKLLKDIAFIPKDVFLYSPKEPKKLRNIKYSPENGKSFNQVIRSFGAKNQDEASDLFNLTYHANNGNYPGKKKGYAILSTVGEEGLRAYIEAKRELDSKGYPKKTKEFIADVVLKRAGHKSDKLKITKENLLHIANVHRATRNIPIRGSPKPVRFYIGENPKKVAIIGRKMEGLVNETREHLTSKMDGKGYEIKTFNWSDEARDEMKDWGQQFGDENGWLTADYLVKTLTFRENKQWVKDRIEKGYIIIDMGDPNNLGISPFYEMEKEIIFQDSPK